LLGLSLASDGSVATQNPSRAPSGHFMRAFWWNARVRQL
jgi:hypothetical protein